MNNNFYKRKQYWDNCVKAYEILQEDTDKILSANTHNGTHLFAKYSRNNFVAVVTVLENGECTFNMVGMFLFISTLMDNTDEHTIISKAEVQPNVLELLNKTWVDYQNEQNSTTNVDLFKDAKFGDKFKRRDGKLVLYLNSDYIDRVEKEVVHKVVDTDNIYFVYANGLANKQIIDNPNDIVAKAE